MKRAAELLEPLRYSPREAAHLLQIDDMSLYRLIREGVFTAIRPNGKGPGKRVWVLGAEVRAYATGGRAGVERYRKRKGGRP